MITKLPPVKDQYEAPSLTEKFAIFWAECSGGGLVYYLILTLSTYFFTDVLYMPAATIGTIVIVSRILDTWSDLLVGHWIDKTNTSWGKVRPWMLIGCIPCVVAMVLMYCTPDNMSPMAQIAYVIITYNLCVTLGFTAWSIPCGTLATVITRDQKERTKATSLRMTGSTLGGILGTSVAMPLINMLGGERIDWILVMTGFAIFILLNNIWAVTHVNERVRDSVEVRSKESSKLDLPSAARNPYFWIGILLNFVNTMCNIGCATLQTYYAKYVLGNTMIMVSMNTIMQLVMAAGCFACVFLLRKWDKVTLIKFAMVITFPGQILLALNPTNVTIMIIAIGLRTIGWGLYGGLFFGCIADACEYGEWRTGHRAAGTTFSAAGIGNKIGVLVASGVYPLLMGLAGYDATLEVQSAAAVSIIKNLYIWTPAVFAVIMLIVMSFYKLEKMYPQIMDDLSKGKYHPKAMYIGK